MASKKNAPAPSKAKRSAKKAAKKAAPEGASLSVARHPRASRQVRLAKGCGGLAGFLAAGYLSLSAGVPLFDAGIRALACGVAGYLFAWACSVSLWRQLMLAELKAHHERLAERAAQQAAGALPLPDGAIATAPRAPGPGPSPAGS